MAHSNSWSRTENGNVLFISEFTQMKWVQAQIRSATGVVVVAFRNYCIWYAMNGIVIFISILVSLNQLIRLRTGITITPCSTLHTIVSLMRFVVKHLFLLFSFSCLINFMFLYLLLLNGISSWPLFPFSNQKFTVSIDEKQTKQTERRIYKWKQSVHNSTYCFNADTDVSRSIQRSCFLDSVMESYSKKNIWNYDYLVALKWLNSSPINLKSNIFDSG